MNHIVSLYEAKTQLSGLVDQAAAGAEIVISKNGVPYAKLVPVAFQGDIRKPAHSLKAIDIPDNFDEPDREIEALFYGSE